MNEKITASYTMTYPPLIVAAYHFPANTIAPVHLLENQMVAVDTSTTAALLDHEDSYALRAARISGTRCLLAAHEPGSRADFIQALELLGAMPYICQPRDGGMVRLAIPVHVSCCRADWATVFGEPTCVEEFRVSAGTSFLHVWKHFCTDGPITCVGHFFERPSGEGRVVVVRIFGF